MTPDDLLQVDEDLYTSSELNLAEIASRVRSLNADADDDDDEDTCTTECTVQSCTANDAREAIQVLNDYFYMRMRTPDILFDHTAEIERFIEKSNREEKRQKKITDFFFFSFEDICQCSC